MVNVGQRIMVTAIIKKAGRYLVLKRSKKNKGFAGYWQFPEGGIEIYESPLEALGRELEEELSLELVNAKLLWLHSSITEFMHLKLHVIRAFYLCKVRGTIKLSEEHSEYKWLTKKQIGKLKLIAGINWEEIKDIIK